MFPIKKRKRATNACLRCRLKKQRCDGISQPCANCAKASSECTFPDDAMGEKFLRQHIAHLEVRVTELSAALSEIDPDHAALKAKETERSELDLVDGFGFLCLTSGAEPLYVGGSSGASWGRIFSSALRNQTGEAHFLTGSLIPPKTSHRSSSPSEAFGRKLSATKESPDFSDIESSGFESKIPMELKTGFSFPPLPQDQTVADEIFAIVHTTIQPRHCFMNFVALKKWYNDREKYCTPRKPLLAEATRTAAFFLWLTHALGLRLWEMRGKIFPGLPSHEYYFQAALQYYDHVSANTTTIQALLFLAMYSFRSANGLSAWHLAGLAMRTALELGLHRKTTKALELDPFNEEMRKRIWWSVYALERTIAFQLGRPISIQEDEIDNELPLDIDCHIADPEQIIARRVAINQYLSETGTTLENNPYPLGWTTMSPSLHHIRLRRILTKIKQTVYHPTFSSETMGARCAHVESLLSELDEWRDRVPTNRHPIKSMGNDPRGIPDIPDNCIEKDQGESSDRLEIPFYNSEWFELQYHNAVQVLLIPCALTASSPNKYLHRAARAAMTSCELQRRRLRKNSQAPLSVYSLHKLFMAGVFMLYALDKDPSLSLNSKGEPIEHGRKSSESENYEGFITDNFTPLNELSQMFPHPLNCCHESLAIYAIHYPQAKSYAQCFKNMAKRWMQRMDRRHLQQTILETPYLNPEKTTNQVVNAGSATVKRSFEEFNIPTLWRNELVLPGQRQKAIEGSSSFNFDTNSCVQSRPSQYDILSLGIVEPDCEPLNLLRSEHERYQSQKPWLLGRTKEESSTSSFGGNLRQIDLSISSNFPSCYQDHLFNLTRTDDRKSGLAMRSVNDELIQHFLDNQAALSDYSSLNEAPSDRNLIQIPISPSFGPDEFSQLPSAVEINPQSLQSARTSLTGEALLNYEGNPSCLEELLAQEKSAYLAKFREHWGSSSDDVPALLTSDLFNLPQESTCLPTNWPGKGSQNFGDDFGLSALGGEVMGFGMQRYVGVQGGECDFGSASQLRRKNPMHNETSFHENL